MLAIGHTSGRDLLSGVSGALRAVDAQFPSPRTSRKEPTVADHVELRTGAYFDSVTLMQVSRTVAAAPGVEAAQVAMATELNLEVIRGMGFDVPDVGAERPRRRDPGRRGRHRRRSGRARGRAHPEPLCCKRFRRLR